MCLLVVKEPDADLGDLVKDLDDINKTNANGFGMAWFYGGKVCTLRNFSTVEEQKRLIEGTKGCHAIFHWRLATGGKINVQNCHPFKLLDGTAFAHNGIISDKAFTPTDKKSDTHVLADKSPDIKTFWHNIATHQMYSNKFAIMDLDGTVYIVREDLGQWKNGMWYSNSTYKRTYHTHYYSGGYEGSSYNGRSNWKAGRVWDYTKKDWVDPPKAQPEAVVKDPAAEIAKATEDALEDLGLEKAIAMIVSTFGYKAVAEAIEKHPKTYDFPDLEREARKIGFLGDEMSHC